MRKKKYTTEEIIEQFREVHGDNYNYDKFIYFGATTKSIVNCNIHGDFYITPSSHKLGHGCNDCAISFRAKQYAKPKQNNSIAYKRRILSPKRRVIV